MKLTENPKEIEKEFSIDSDMAPLIKECQAYCGKFGILKGRSEYGWYQVLFEDGYKQWFPPFCIWILQNQFSDISKAIDIKERPFIKKEEKKEE